MIKIKAEMFASIYLFNSCSVIGGFRRKKGQTIRRSHDATGATLSSSTRKESGRNGYGKAEKGTNRI